ncbi:MAG: hypothetical protein AB1916_12285 [Thermodesulfobacteriota bacterium]
MRRLRCAVLVAAALALCSCAARPWGALAEPGGFRGLAWGARASDRPELRQVGEDGDETCYVRQGEKYRIGEIEVQNIYYCFFQDAFYHARVEFPPEQFPGVKYLLYLKYGLPHGADNEPGESPDEFMTRYYWEFSDTRLALSDSGTLNYFSKSGTARWMRALDVFDDI